VTRSRLIGVVTSTLVALAACGYSGESNVRELTEDELFGLDQTTTTSTSTTTTTAPASPASIDRTSTTSTLPVAIEAVSLYFLDGDGLVAVQRNLTRRPSLQRVLDALEDGPQQAGPAGLGLRSAILEGLIGDVSQSGGVVTVELVPEVYERIDASNELAVIAQIVLTLTDQPGVGQVRFTRGDEPIRVRLGNNQVSTPGEEVAQDDYVVLLEADVAPGSLPPADPGTTAPDTSSPPGTATTATGRSTTTSTSSIARGT